MIDFLRAALIMIATGAGSSLAQAGCDGVLFEVASGEPVAFQLIVEAAATSGTVMIGERHGVKEHPVAAACFVREISKTADTTIILEMLPEAAQARADNYRAQHPEIADGLGLHLEWWKSGWPSWPVYAPLFEAAWQTRSRILAGDPSEVTNNSLDAGSANLKKENSKATPNSVLASWSKSMKAAHCDLITVDSANGLAEHQIARDQFMTRQLQASKVGEPLLAAPKGRQPNRPGLSLLYAGRAHIREDRSAGWQMRQVQSPSDPVTIALYETSAVGQETDRGKILAEARGLYDYVWFVGSVTEPEACERLQRKGLIPVAKTGGTP